jgi:hypothetical protein
VFFLPNTRKYHTLPRLTVPWMGFRNDQWLMALVDGPSSQQVRAGAAGMRVLPNAMCHQQGTIQGIKFHRRANVLYITRNVWEGVIWSNGKGKKQVDDGAGPHAGCIQHACAHGQCHVAHVPICTTSTVAIVCAAIKTARVRPRCLATPSRVAACLTSPGGPFRDVRSSHAGTEQHLAQTCGRAGTLSGWPFSCCH